MNYVSISHWGLIPWPADRPPRVVEPGHRSYPAWLLAGQLGIHWTSIDMAAAAAGVRLEQ